MKIHHVTIPAHDPEHVAGVLAELLGGRVIPLPQPLGTHLVYAGDEDGTALEIWPAKLRLPLEGAQLALRDLPLPEAWPHHAYVSSDACEPERVLEVFAREGWRAQMVRNGPPGVGFSLIRGFIENHAGIEIVGRGMREEYESFFRGLLSGAPRHG